MILADLEKFSKNIDARKSPPASKHQDSIPEETELMNAPPTSSDDEDFQDVQEFDDLSKIMSLEQKYNQMKLNLFQQQQEGLNANLQKDSPCQVVHHFPSCVSVQGNPVCHMNHHHHHHMIHAHPNCNMDEPPTEEINGNKLSENDFPIDNQESNENMNNLTDNNKVGIMKKTNKKNKKQNRINRLGNIVNNTNSVSACR